MKRFSLVSFYDTETSRTGDNDSAVAYTISWQFNDLRNVDLSQYSAKDDDIRIYRNVDDVMNYIDTVVAYGKAMCCVPIIAAYNLMFDLQSILHLLHVKWPHCEVMAQNGTSVYTMDFHDESNRHVLRFWDMFYMYSRGLSQMGDIAGLKKLTGDWNYNLMRTPETPLTDLEKGYAARDVQVLPAYCKYLLNNNDWLTQDMLGNTVMTSTGVVRQFARRVLGVIPVSKRMTMWNAYTKLCKDESPRDFKSYAMRRACFRGGLSFTAAATADMVVRNVASLDVTSMHHTFMSPRLPVQFNVSDTKLLQMDCENVLKTSRETVLKYYDNPFQAGLHCEIEFTNIRIRRNTCFEKWGIATLARGKFLRNAESYGEYADNRVELQENEIRKGYRDVAVNGVFAFGKLYSADKAILHLSEIELWIVGRVYEWDSMRVIRGESTVKTIPAPEYVGLQSMTLYTAKNNVKKLVKTYDEGKPYEGVIADTIPVGLAEKARDGSLTCDELESFYLFTKGMFNSVYGICAQDVYRCDFKMNGDDDIVVNKDNVTTEDNFDERQPSVFKVLYTEGLRIVGRSRLHLVLAMELLFEKLGGAVQVTGGDTDSLKVACADTVTDEMLLDALQPLHDAADTCLRKGYSHIREKYPEYYNLMNDVGHFDIEKCGNAHRYPWHIELWTKCRVSFDTDSEPHVTCAGLRRPEGMYTILDTYRELFARHGAEYALTHGIGFNVFIGENVCHMLMTKWPKSTDTVDMDITDYLGNKCHVKQYQAVLLYPEKRLLGGLTNQENYETVMYLKNVYNRKVNVTYRYIDKNNCEYLEM